MEIQKNISGTNSAPSASPMQKTPAPAGQPTNRFTESKKGTGSLIVSGILLVVLVAGAFYLSFSKTSIQEQQQQLDGQINDLKNQVNNLQGKKVQSAQAAQQFLEKMAKEEIRWSTVLKSVQDFVPLDVSSQKSRIKFLSYAAAVGGKLTMNAQTMDTSVDPMNDISELIKAFNNSSVFSQSYVPTLNRGVTADGKTIITFTFVTTYHETNVSSSELPSLTNSSSNSSTSTTSTPPTLFTNTQQSSASTSGSQETDGVRVSRPR